MANHKKREMVIEFQQKFANKMDEWGFSFNNIDLYQQAFSHSSFINDFNMNRLDHNERLEFLGDAVVEFLTSIHLYFLFPDLEEGGLATYRAALVQNQHLAILARKLQLEKFMLYAHGSDLCHDLELRHAMANCFEAFMGALFLDGGINVADHVFSSTLFDDNDEQSKLLHRIWSDYPKHPIQQQYPNGDRHLIDKVNRLSELAKFEQMTGIEFHHIRLLARAFTHRSVGYNNLTLAKSGPLKLIKVCVSCMNLL